MSDLNIPRPGFGRSQSCGPHFPCSDNEMVNVGKVKKLFKEYEEIFKLAQMKIDEPTKNKTEGLTNKNSEGFSWDFEIPCGNSGGESVSSKGARFPNSSFNFLYDPSSSSKKRSNKRKAENELERDTTKTEKDQKESSRCFYPKCHLSGVDLKICSKCKLAMYCSVECQKNHWKAHKSVCRLSAE